MTWNEFLIFMMIPAGALAVGYFAMRISERETERFDSKRNQAA